MSIFDRWRLPMRRTAQEINESLAEEYLGERAPRKIRYGIYGALTLFVALVMLGWFWSEEPAQVDVRAVARQQAGNQSGVIGVTTLATTVQVVDVMLGKRGGYLSNDIAPPGIWLDNLPSWEYGALLQVRDISTAMRDAFSRSQSQSTEDKDLSLAQPRFHVDHSSWAMPWPESEYAQGSDYFQSYRDRLVDNDDFDAQFFARADNLRHWLGTVEARLGSLSQRLSASVGQRRINTDLAGEEASRQSTPAPGEMEIKTSWSQIDNVFYEARGASWALLHFLRAVQVDFAAVLAKKNAEASLEQIIRELEMTQQPINTPMIFNGKGFGMFANHSLVMASYISRANAAIIDLRELLAQG